jgi:hypothetical protein
MERMQKGAGVGESKSISTGVVVIVACLHGNSEFQERETLSLANPWQADKNRPAPLKILNTFYQDGNNYDDQQRR